MFALPLLAFAAGAASAAPQGASPFAIQNLGFETTVAAIVPAGSSSDPQSNANDRLMARDRGEWLPSGWSRQPATHSGTRNDAIRYRSRASRSRGPVVESPVQFHLGFFDADGGGSGSFVGGIRGGPQIDRHIQIGGGVDWVHRSEDATVVAGDPYTQGGNTITPTRVLSRASSNLFPFQLFMQVSGDQDMPVIPFGGISGGYQLLLLSADDFATQSSYDATFGGWGWQAWAGAGIPLSGQSRLTGEVFLNQSNPERDVADLNGFEYRERVDADGVGMRFGIQWGF
jgi:hypothetical protein